MKEDPVDKSQESGSSGAQSTEGEEDPGLSSAQSRSCYLFNRGALLPWVLGRGRREGLRRQSNHPCNIITAVSFPYTGANLCSLKHREWVQFKSKHPET